MPARVFGRYVVNHARLLELRDLIERQLESFEKDIRPSLEKATDEGRR